MYIRIHKHPGVREDIVKHLHPLNDIPAFLERDVSIADEYGTLLLNPDKHPMLSPYTFSLSLFAYKRSPVVEGRYDTWFPNDIGYDLVEENGKFLQKGLCSFAIPFPSQEEYQQNKELQDLLKQCCFEYFEHHFQDYGPGDFIVLYFLPWSRDDRPWGDGRVLGRKVNRMELEEYWVVDENGNDVGKLLDLYPA